jgi:membrane protease subunit (stomatin/prohibitin family)
MMGIFDKLRNELIDIIEWLDDSQHTLVWRFPRYQNEIKNGAQLIVRPGQVAVFVREGEVAEVFEPGAYTLSTQNLPILSSLAGWKYGFDSPFKAEVYFVSTRQLTDLKWGTPNPIMLRDADFGPIRLRAFGSYALRAVAPQALIRELVGTDSRFEAAEVTELIKSLIISAFAEILGRSQIAALDLAARYQELGEAVRRVVCERIDDEYGLELTALNIINIALPEEVEKALDQRSSMAVIGDLQRYQQYQMGNAWALAAGNPAGGGAALGLGLGMGAALGHQMLPGLNAAHLNGGGLPAASSPPANARVGGPPAPPGMPGAPLWHVASNGRSFGPYTLAQLGSAATQGQLGAATSVWCAGMQGWMPAAQVPELTSLFGHAPPPPPPPPPPIGD